MVNLKDPVANDKVVMTENMALPVEKHAHFKSPTYAGDGLQHFLTICHNSYGGMKVLFEINHVIIDGFSVNILMKDLKRADDGVGVPDAVPYSTFSFFVSTHSVDDSLNY
jgi:hypothetical protein